MRITLFAIARRSLPLLPLGIIVFFAIWAADHGTPLVGRRGVQRELQALIVILPYLPYAVFLSTGLMGGCVQNAGLMLAAWFSGLLYFQLAHAGAGYFPLTLVQLRLTEPPLVIIPLTLLGLSGLNRKRLSLRGRVWWVIGIGGLALFLACLGKARVQSLPWIHKALAEGLGTGFHAIREALGTSLEPITRSTLFARSGLSGAVFIGVIGVTLFRFFKRQDILVAGFAGLMLSVWLGMQPQGTGLARAIYFSTGALMLMITAIWSTFVLAYHDELTGLASRRSLNETMASLGRSYTIAMIDVDHFKKFNDTYGHKTGDQVLKLIATQMQLLSGSARIFRYGGEEFTAIFPEKSLESAVAKLEQFRETLAATPFMIRGGARKKGSAAQRGGKGGQTRSVYITVSIGAAVPGKGARNPAAVIKAADKALYRAKKAGRNRVMV